LCVAADAAEIVRFFSENNDFLAKTQNPRTGNALTEPFWVRYAERARAEFLNDKSCRLIMIANDSARVLGIVNFTAFVRGYFQACTLGYALAESEQGTGLMTEALREAISYVFGVLDFHRVMANYAPTNVRSAKVLDRLGFREEGRAPDYIRINGVWIEHVLTALHNPAWRGDFAGD
jgi:ribosomal-protein-alanine N-acetyltransferase